MTELAWFQMVHAYFCISEKAKMLHCWYSHIKVLADMLQCCNSRMSAGQSTHMVIFQSSHAKPCHLEYLWVLIRSQYAGLHCKHSRKGSVSSTSSATSMTILILAGKLPVPWAGAGHMQTCLRLLEAWSPVTFGCKHAADWLQPSKLPAPLLAGQRNIQILTVHHTSGAAWTKVSALSDPVSPKALIKSLLFTDFQVQYWEEPPDKRKGLGQFSQSYPSSTS